MSRSLVRPTATSIVTGLSGLPADLPYFAAVSSKVKITCVSLGAQWASMGAAARAVGADEFVQRLPEGYGSAVGERGVNLSVGQRQLVAFARALLADPRILILDEATSSVDTETEMVIRRALEHLLAGRTAFVIAHRLSTIVNADQIVVLSAGQVVEHGTHAQLLARRGAYYKLYTMQWAPRAAAAALG